jgi:signal transduction histidine kinase
MFGIGALFHYPDQLVLPSVFKLEGLTRHAMERVLFLLPIIYSGFIIGFKSGLAATVVAIAIMVPRVIWFSPSPVDALLETVAVVVIGVLVNVWFEGYRRERKRARQTLRDLREAQKVLQSNVQIIKSNEKRLAALNKVSAVVNQTLDLQDVLGAAADKVMEVMEVDIVLVFLLDERSQQLELRVYRGVSDEFAYEMEGLKLGEGFNGQVAQTGQPLVVEDVASDPRLSRQIVTREGIRAQLIVPLRAKDKVVGTVSVATRSPRPFVSEDIEVLCGVANNIGVAVENARLYERERVMAEQIAKDAATEKRMRENLDFYLQQVTRAQEEERQRIARELHDETAQELIAIARQLDGIVSRNKNLSVQDISLLEALRAQADRTLDGVRRFSQDLRPSVLDDLGLLPALEWLSSDVSQHLDINVEMNVVGSARRFTPEVELLLFRIAQEALRNVWKHSGASKAWVSVEFGNDKTVLTIKDNGKGFKLPESIGGLAATGKLGLVGMQERARLLNGNLTVQSEPGVGTTVTVAVHSV